MSQHIKITYRRQSSGWHRWTVSSYGEIVASGSEKRKEDAMALARNGIGVHKVLDRHRDGRGGIGRRPQPRRGERQRAAQQLARVVAAWRAEQPGRGPLLLHAAMPQH